jgi:hypothetical protein
MRQAVGSFKKAYMVTNSLTSYNYHNGFEQVLLEAGAGGLEILL